MTKDATTDVATGVTVTLREAAGRSAAETYAEVGGPGSAESGLSSAEAANRLRTIGPNAVRTHKARVWPLLWQQLRSPILILLFVTAAVSLFLGDAANSVIIGVILVVSVGLGFVNEFRAQLTADSLHDKVRHTVIAVRDGRAQQTDVVDLVPGDVVRVSVGTVVPADMRVLASKDLLCDESILTGESLPVAKDPAPVSGDRGIEDLTSCLLMGTIIQSGSGTGVVIATGGNAEFGKIALGLGTSAPVTEFQKGLSHFSVLLLQVAIVLTTFIFIANVLLQRPIIESLLFSLAIAVGITPQLLPAVVSTSLATGSRMLIRKKVLVKRLVCIEDLGDMDLLVTDKTGTLTEGTISFIEALSVDETITPKELVELGLLATEVVGHTFANRTGPGGETRLTDSNPVDVVGLNPLDAALWLAPDARGSVTGAYTRLDLLPFDHDRRMVSALVTDADGITQIVSKGSPEDILKHCVTVPARAQAVLDAQYSQGARVIAVAQRVAPGLAGVDAIDEHDLTLSGFLTFRDMPKADARGSLERLAMLGIQVKIATGDNAIVAEKVCADLGLISADRKARNNNTACNNTASNNTASNNAGTTLLGEDIDALSDSELGEAALAATIFARVSPEQKARIITQLRHRGRSVAFLGDGVNDALALHQADVGISVETAADVAKDAADVLLLDKDLAVLADGVIEGRRIFANTIKYVLMGTSSNFGNMFSAATASVVLPFLPMLPGQILLNNLLYDSGQLAIPTDHVDKEQLLSPSHWNIAYIRRFMLLFGPISSLFDFATFALMLFVFNASEGEFRAGWFIESIATQTLIIFAIRTRRVPFLRSRPSIALAAASLGVVALGIWLPFSPFAGFLGFATLPPPFFLVLLGMIVVYLFFVELAKLWFFSRAAQQSPQRAPRAPRQHTHPSRISRRAARFTSRSPRYSSRKHDMMTL
ncbi:magnesium-translocating P-type ATPase [Subtercola sp. PAMC28395]|uniref:magnesium-translocating P-type ATPase n=1 Tax=Subtercola sp. PAMC28395 TaxID=2846775 RepID=UPI00209AD985|nr:magnesium-translocating P-type ATPase [Subtercola sp. PAMC28395]